MISLWWGRLMCTPFLYMPSVRGTHMLISAVYRQTHNNTPGFGFRHWSRCFLSSGLRSLRDAPVNTNTECFHCERSARHESHKVQWGWGFTARDNRLSGCMWRDLDQQEAQPVISLDFTNLPQIRQHHVTITVTAILFKTGGLFWGQHKDLTLLCLHTH